MPLGQLLVARVEDDLQLDDLGVGLLPRRIALWPGLQFLIGAAGLADLLGRVGQLPFQGADPLAQLVLAGQLRERLFQGLLHLQLLALRQFAIRQGRQGSLDGLPAGRFGSMEGKADE